MTEDFKINDGVLTFSPEVRYLKGQLLAGNPDIKKVIIPESVGFMEEEVFAECPNLTEVIFPLGLINIGVASFTSCEKLASLDIPGSVKTIEEGAFLDCAALRQVHLHEGLESIADLAFQSTAIEEIIVPASVKEIGEEAFFECESLRRADVLNKDAAIGLNAFGSDYNLIRGYMAPGFPREDSRSAELLYSLLWAGCPERHSPETCARAEHFIRDNEALVMERIFKYNNIPAMHGLADRQLLKPGNIDAYVRRSIAEGYTEITALLLKAKGAAGNIQEDFEL